MEIIDIIKESFIFPSQNLEKLAIYIVLMFVLGLLAVGGIVTGALGFMEDTFFFIFTAVLFVLALVISFLITGYQISILKSGIDFDEEAPAFDWLNDIVTGIKMFIVSIVYFIIPTIIVSILSLVTNIPGQILQIGRQAALTQANATAVANGTTPLATVSQAAMANLFTSIAITSVIAVILFVIFAFLQTMGQSRLANTGSLAEAVNVIEAFKYITRIGAGKVIAVNLLVMIIVALISGILGYISSQVTQFSILSIIVTPYLAFFTQRAIGLLYSDIA